MEDFEVELKTSFLEMASSALNDAEKCFLKLESNQGNETIEEIFRIVHNLKSSAMAAGYNVMGQFSHKVESLLIKIKNRQVAINLPIVNLLLQCNDRFIDMVKVYSKDLVAPYNCSDIEMKLDLAINGNLPLEAPLVSPPVSKEPSPTEDELEVDPAPEASLFAEAETVTNTVSVSETFTVSNSAPAAALSAAPASASTPTTTKAKSPSQFLNQRYLHFSLGSGQYAIPLLSVREVIAIPKLQKVPQSPSYFMGIMNLRGQVISVLNIGVKLGLKQQNNQTQKSEESAIVICDLEGTHVGVLVDSVNSVIHPAPEHMSPRPALQPEHTSLDPSSINAVYRKPASQEQGEELILILDLIRCLSLEDRKSLQFQAQQQMHQQMQTKVA